MTSVSDDGAGRFEVAVVGYGPTGVTLAAFLGSHGIRTVVIERAADVYARARAVTMDGKTIRLFQSLGLSDALTRQMDVTPAVRWKSYDGRELHRTVYSPTPGPSGHASSYMIYQPAVEATLRSAVAGCSSVDVRLGEELVHLDETSADSPVELLTRDEQGLEHRYRASYVVAADGGSSAVRRILGIPLTGQTRQRTWIVIDAKVKRWWPERQLLTFWSDAARPCVDVPLALDHHRWEFPLAEHESPADFATDDALWRLLAPLGIGSEQVEILHTAFYNHHVRKAADWRHGRIFLAGDAAHMMPPWAGQGMQSGMRDAVDLSWKLRAVLRHGVHPDLLDSYQVERRPNVAAVTRQSVRLGEMIELEPGRRNPSAPLRRVMDRIRGPRAGAGVPPEIHAGFVTGVPARDNLLGTVIPQPHIALQTGRRLPLDEVLGTDFAVIGLDVDPASVLSSGQRDAWERLGARLLTLRSSGAAPQENEEIVDFEDVLAPWFQRNRVRVVVVRPDRFVVATDPTGLDLPPGTSFRSDEEGEPGV